MIPELTRNAPAGPIHPGQFALAVPADPGSFLAEPTYVGSINDRPEQSVRMARKFRTPADALTYRDARPHLASAVVVGPLPGEG